LFFPSNPSDFKEESASCVFKSSSFSCNREGLAGESSNKEVKANGGV